MTYTTELALNVVLHIETLSGLFLDIECIWMTVGAIKPLLVRFMRELRPWYHAPVRRQVELAGEFYRLKIFIQNTLLRVNQTLLRCLDPVDLVAIGRVG